MISKHRKPQPGEGKNKRTSGYYQRPEVGIGLIHVTGARSELDHGGETNRLEMLPMSG